MQLMLEYVTDLHMYAFVNLRKKYHSCEHQNIKNCYVATDKYNILILHIITCIN